MRHRQGQASFSSWQGSCPNNFSAHDCSGSWGSDVSKDGHLIDMRSAPDGDPAGHIRPGDRNAMYVPFDVWYTVGTLMITCAAGAVGSRLTAGSQQPKQTVSMER